MLEFGTGSGYQAAVLSGLVTEVYTIEIVEPLAKSAEATLQRLGCKNVHVKAGDGYKGWPEHAPFDSIIVTCAPDHVPQPLDDQLGRRANGYPGRSAVGPGWRLAKSTVGCGAHYRCALCVDERTGRSDRGPSEVAAVHRTATAIQNFLDIWRLGESPLPSSGASAGFYL
jgi:hypothetical protein